MDKVNPRRRRRRTNNRHLSENYAYTGTHQTETQISLTQYDEHSLSTQPVKTADIALRKLADPAKINWFQVSGLTDAERITHIVRECGLHNLDAKDILTPQHVIKIEEREGHLLVILNSCYYNENKELRSEHISLVVTGNLVVSFTESNNPVFENVARALKDNLLNIRKKGTGLLLAFLLNTVTANLADAASEVEILLEDIEEELLDSSARQGENFGQKIQERRRDYITIRKNSQPLKDQFTKLMRSESGIITPELLPIFGDIADQIAFIIQTMEGCREVISSLVDLFISNNDLKMNAIMKRLTVVSTIFIPLTFLAGIWGMNFRLMPELDWRYGYLAAWGIMIVSGLGTWFFLKKKEWY
ncbi:magnesium/cobalt transporter CorA [Parabacteroides sp. PF5-6]|uniref:magnesium/cobalt transporter CorA n=1 Tax=Parabacteroides sp. PF5-6 TaxID=1742403 RepID=UPI00240739DB|nr:magnesium/cobalt transporter CorA [Parabacteroides sp. PF5-6]MDF9828801.1 magnesium transporter [Parabacteroides sp. PF5-6]